MRIESVTLREIRAKMREPFETSFGVDEDKHVIVVEVLTDNGATGFAECVASTAPLYSEETVETSWSVMKSFLIPALFNMEFHTVHHLHQVKNQFSPFKRNTMAKAALEMAVWDAWAALTNTPLVNLIGGTKTDIPVGISIGIQPSVDALLRKVAGYLEQGFQRMKVKVKPGWDIEPLRQIRKEFGDIPLMADANSAYRLADIEHLRKFDALGLTMIEQPLAHDDIVDHATLQKHLETSICLDESIHSLEDARKAVELGACKIINIKLGRVGGFSEALAIHDYCLAQQIPVWCGGMLETGIGRLHNIALTALPGFTLPGDTAPSARYFDEDLIQPPVAFERPGFLAVEALCGVASRVQRDRLNQWTVQTATFTR
jgi:o-succinylbenzoate synthase